MWLTLMDVGFVYNSALETSIPKIFRGCLRPEDAAAHPEQLYVIHWPSDQCYLLRITSLLREGPYSLHTASLQQKISRKGNKKGARCQACAKAVRGEKMQVPRVRYPSVFACLLGKCRV